jgi:DNA-binding NarL/FixJ family response regulator
VEKIRRYAASSGLTFSEIVSLAFESPMATGPVAEGIVRPDSCILEKSAPQKLVVAKGQRKEMLTRREMAVLDLLEKGFCNKEIASSLGISVDTVKFHLKNIFSIIGVHDRLRAARWAACLEACHGSSIFAQKAQLICKLRPKLTTSDRAA